MRGRKPKPTALKILAGAQPCRINRSEAAIPAAHAVDPPVWVGEFGAECWAALSPILERAGLLTEGDLPAFALLCSEYDGIRRDPLDKGSRERYRRLLVEFGLTPSSRSRIKVSPEAPKDELEIFLGTKSR